MLAVMERKEEMMSSLEIAELTGKNHKEVMRDIRRLIEQGAIAERSFALGPYIDAQNQERPMYMLNFLGTLVLISGYDAVLRSIVLDQWIKFKKMVAATSPTSLTESLRLHTDELAKKQRDLAICRQAWIGGGRNFMDARPATRRRNNRCT